jgi:hypothetical protein
MRSSVLELRFKIPVYGLCKEIGVAGRWEENCILISEKHSKLYFVEK